MCEDRPMLRQLHNRLLARRASLKEMLRAITNLLNPLIQLNLSAF